MEDVQNNPAEVAMPIDKVGVKNLKLPLITRDKKSGHQHTVACIDLSVELPANFKGTHMSRFIESLEAWNDKLDHESFKSLLADISKRLEAKKAYAKLSFPFFMELESPVSGMKSRMGYSCVMEGEYQDGRLTYALTVEVPVMTVCPCSKAISDEGAHSQRSLVRIKSRFKGFLWLEDLIEIASGSGSCPVYPLLKREDEKYVTEKAFATPCFVEDVVRNAAQGLARHPHITWFKVEVESFESIHDHSAFAQIESTSCLL